MTTKHKIISGFFIMIALLFIVSAVSYRDMQSSSEGVREYARLATFNSNASDLVAYLRGVDSYVYVFLDNKNKQNMSEASRMLERAVGSLNDADTQVRLPERKAILATLRKDADAMRGLLEKVGAQALAAYDGYLNTVQPMGQELGTKLMGIADQARSIGNTDGVYIAAECLDLLTRTRSMMSRFAENRSKEDAQKAPEYFARLSNALDKFSPVSESGKRMRAEIMSNFTAMRDAANTMSARYIEVNSALEELSRTLSRMIDASAKLSSEVDAQAARNNEQIALAAAASQRTLLAISGGGLVIGVVLAVLIIIGLIRVLAEAGRFAGAVANGDFSSSFTVRERGEIGRMLDSMRAIPRTIEGVIAQAGDLSNAIASGWMRKRLDASALPGAYSDVARAINAVSDAYTGLLDTLTQPIIASDNSQSIMFLNTAAQRVLGGNHIGESCGKLFNSEVCNSENCFSRCAMRQNKSHESETTVKVGDSTLNIAVTAIPLYDLNKRPTGCVEVVTDLTQIRTQQANVMRAVAEASEISDRVAAASEELAAQVEQISSGAEVQRARVESTASAMTEMNSTVIEVARSAGMASEQSDGTRHKAEAGAGLVNSVVASINQVNNVAITLQDNMQELGKQAEGIGGVMNVISDIADQTNLLALNAAIEAARAGEAGRGFAVVADEVRKLAEKTMSATQEVGSNIRSIQNAASVNIGEVNNAVRSIREATDLANSSGTALKEIVDLASSNSAVVASIATAAEEQSATSEEINRSIDEINRIVADTANGMIQSSSAVQDLSRMAQELRRVMERLGRQ